MVLARDKVVELLPVKAICLGVQPKDLLVVAVSGIPSARKPTTRTP